MDKLSNEMRQVLYLHLEYFGGVDYENLTIDRYFEELGDHFDLGREPETVSRITSQLQQDLIDRV